MRIKKHKFMIIQGLLMCCTIIGIPFGLILILRYFTDSIVYDDNTIQLRQGIITVDSDVMKFKNISQHHFNKSICGRIFGYSTLKLKTSADGMNIEYPFIPNKYAEDIEIKIINA